MAQKEEKSLVEDQSANSELRATIEATQKALEQSAAEIERAKRLLRETEDLGETAAQPTRPAKENRS
jgi:AmiR/NasT family two-component response regulator